MHAPGPQIVNRPATPARTLSPASSLASSPARMPTSATTQTLQAAMGGSRTSPAMPAMPAVDARINMRLQAILGERFYRMDQGRGQVIELPADMTQADAAKLEAEAITATQKLGKGPSPQAVPDVRKAAEKTGKKGAGKLDAKGRKGSAAGRRASTRTGAGKGRLQDASGKVAQYLIGKARPVLARGTAMLAKLSGNEQTHDNATQKLQQSEKAVVSPVSENQSRSNASQVTAVGARPAPVVDEKKGKSALQESLRENVPRSIEDVDNFKRDRKGQHIGADVLKVTQADKNAVVSTFADMSQTPPPAAPEQTPEALPPAELAPATPALQLGQNAVAPLQREHTDVSKFTSEADTKLKEEGVTQEQLDMVDSGDLASANKEKKGMAQMATTQPAAIQQFAKQEATKVDASLQQEEKKQRSAVSARRKNGLGATGEKQRGAKSALEKKRDEVAAHINGLHKATQTKVTKKLSDLETQSMKRFDEGNTRATRDFDDGVKRDIDAFKDDRYSGWFGWARKAKDWLKGMDKLPAVKAIFDRNRATFVSSVDALVSDISAENKRVIQECKDDLERTRVEIKDYVDKLGPALKTIGNKIAGEVSEQLDAMDGFIKKKEEELQQQLADKQQAAIKAIDEKIEKMKEAMAGALAKLGKLLLWAAKKFFTWALTKFGYSLGDIEGIISKGAAVLKAIFTQPIAFVKNLVRAAIMGFENFGKNFLKHLKDALFEWLTGSLEGLKLPSVWNLQGVVGVALQMIGISYANLRKHMVTAMGETVVSGLEKTFTLVKTLVTEGPMAAWEQLKGIAGEMSDAFVAAVKDFIKTKIIEQAIQWVVSLFVPGAGIVKAVIGIYDTVVFFIQKAKQIAKMVANFLGSIAEIAAGNVGAAAQAMEDGLARGLSLVINFLASLLRLNGITAKIREAIQKIHGKVDDVLAKLANWVAAKAGKLLSRAVGGDPNATPQQRLDKGMDEAYAAVTKYTGKPVGAVVLRPLLAVIRARHRMTRLDVVLESGKWTIEGEVNPKAKRPTPVEGTGAKGFKSSVHYYPANGNRGATRMLADPIGPDFKEFGSRPSEAGAPPIWEKVNIRRNSDIRLYVLGHLLNHRLGGTGASSSNLTPITFSMNARHYSQVENHIVDNIGTKTKPRWYRYEVVVNYPSSGRAISAADSTKGVVSAEGLLAKSFDCTWQELAEDPAKPGELSVLAGSKKEKVTVDHDIPPYPDT